MSTLQLLVDAATSLDLHAARDVAVDRVRDLAECDPSKNGSDSCPGLNDGTKIAESLQKFVAPIVAVVIGLVSLKFLFGENKSLAGFISFFLLAIACFGLIWFGDKILTTLANTIGDWVG